MSSAHTGDYAVHYGTEPLLGFHVAQAFSDKPGDGTKKVLESVVDVAKAQFRAWCSSFKRYVDNGCVRLNLFSGEAIALCHELQLRLDFHDGLNESARAYVQPWSSHRLLLDGTAEILGRSIGPFLGFDVIDTSNLSDHVGLINILTATTLLLSKAPSSVLYTESLIKASKSVDKSLSDVLGSDLTTFSLLIGLVPVGLLSGVTMEAVSNEMGMALMQGQQASGQQQYRMRVPWKFAEITDTMTMSSVRGPGIPNLEVEFEPQALADYLFSLYLSVRAFDTLLLQSVPRCYRMP